MRVNGQRARPAREVKVGDVLLIAREDSEYEVTIAGIPGRRGPAAEASRQYVESEASIERRREAAEQRSVQRGMLSAPTTGRPDKRTRRLMRAKRHVED